MFNVDRSFNSILSHDVKPGATLSDVQQRLGPGTVPDEKQRQALIRATRDFVQQTPESYPDGAEINDQFISDEIAAVVHYLQFRNGRIINFDPCEYDHSFVLKGACP